MKIKLTFIPFLWTSLFSTCLFGQNKSDTADALLWYKGILIKKNTLKLPNGSVVTYDPANNSVTINSSPGSDQLQPVEDALKNDKQEEQQMDNQILNEQPNGVNYQLAQSANKEFEQVDAEFNTALNPTLPIPKEYAPPTQSGEEQLLQSLLSNFCPQGQSDFNEIMAFYNTNRNNHNFNVDPPPYQDYDNCWTCHPYKEVKFDTDMVHYEKSFWEPESDLIRKILGIEKTLELIGFPEWGNGAASSDFSNNFYDGLMGSKNHPGGCHWIDQPKLKDALYFLASRQVEKAAFLYKKYGKDYHRLSGVIKIYLSALKDEALITGTNNEDQILPELGGAVGAWYDDYRDRIFSKGEWNQLPNISFLLGLMRNYALLGGDPKQTLIDDFLKNKNRFKISIDADCKMGDKGEYQLAHISGDNYIRFWSVDSPKCINSDVIIGDPTQLQYTGNLSLKLQATEFVVPQGKAKFTYRGSYDWYSLVPDFRFHGCANANDMGGDDTIIVHQLTPTGDKEKWFMEAPQYGQEMDINYTQNLVNNCFFDKKNALKESSKAKDPNVQQAMKDSAMKIAMRMMNHKQDNSNASMQAASQASSIQNGTGLSQQITTAFMPAAPGNYLFSAPIETGSQEVFNHKLDGTKLFPENKKIVYANFTLKIVHEAYNDK